MKAELAQNSPGAAGGLARLTAIRGALMQRFAKESFFSSSFRNGMLAGAMIIGLCVGWLYVRWDEGAILIQPEIPSKAVKIAKGGSEKTAPQNGGEGAPKEALPEEKKIEPLPPAPIEGLYEKTTDGALLPISRISDDMSPFQAYKRPFKAISGRPKVSFVIMDYGLSEKISKTLLENIPPDVSFVLNPYTADAAKWASAARAYGHEFWLSLPMQTENFSENDSGPKTILLDAPIEKNRQKLFDLLGGAQGYAGLVTQPLHVFSQKEQQDKAVLEQIFGRGLAIAESNPDRTAYGLSMAMEFGYPYVQNHFWLDADLRPRAIDHALKEIELQAGRKGKVVVFLHPYPAVLKKVQEWTGSAEERGFQIAPLSAMVD
jgi:polysaccharide deacetylase 2 family uncharacterized protein YibQ